MSPRNLHRTHDAPLVSEWEQWTMEDIAYNGNYVIDWSQPTQLTRTDKVRNYDEFSSESHGRYWARNRGPLNDTGGDFTSRRSSLSSTGVPIGHRTRRRSNRWMALDVPFIQPHLMAIDSATIELDDLLHLGPLGASAIDACRPGKPESDMLVSLVELVREGLPKAVGARTLGDPSLKGASGDWLNYQFGVAPMISDVKSLIDTARNQEATIQKINASSGRPVRRRYEFPGETSVSKVPLKNPDVLWPRWPTKLHSGGENNYPAGFRVDSTSRRVWFSGSFTSYVSLPKEDRAWSERTAEIAKHLYGVRVSPELIWNLTPWTWAADWVTNAGDVVSNASAFLSGDVVMHRGYIMAETKVKRHWHVSLPAKDPHKWTSDYYVHAWDELKMSQDWWYTSKVRRRANPYTVGFTGEGLDPKQVSILVALGISRG